MKCWFISDTHLRHGFLDIPSDVEMVICAGDCSNQMDSYSNEHELRSFIQWFESLSHIKHKIWIAGNHDTSIERGLIKPKELSGYRKHWIYLHHEKVEIDINKNLRSLINSDKKGSTLIPKETLKIFGSPYTPTFGSGWAFNVSRQKIDKYWQQIPENLDVLITHGPPLGILDHTECGSQGERGSVQCGCKSLRNRVFKNQPRFHVFGHIHNEENCPNAGILELQEIKTKFINASVVDLDYKICNNGFVIDI